MCSWENWLCRTRQLLVLRKALRRHDRFDECQQTNSGILKLSVCLLVCRGSREDSSPIHLEVFANVTSREHWCKSMARQMVAQHATEIHKFMCQGVGKRSEDIFDRQKAPGQPRAAVQQESAQGEQQNEQQHQQHETYPQPIDLLVHLCFSLGGFLLPPLLSYHKHLTSGNMQLVGCFMRKTFAARRLTSFQRGSLGSFVRSIGW